MLEFATALARISAGNEEGPPDLRSFARCRLARLRRRCRRRFKVAADLEPPHLHRLRIAMKEMRYAVEFFAPLFPKKAVRRYRARLTRTQGVLGILQDLVIARRRLDD